MTCKNYVANKRMHLNVWDVFRTVVFLKVKPRNSKVNQKDVATLPVFLGLNLWVDLDELGLSAGLLHFLKRIQLVTTSNVVCSIVQLVGFYKDVVGLNVKVQDSDVV